MRRTVLRPSAILLPAILASSCALQPSPASPVTTRHAVPMIGRGAPVHAVLKWNAFNPKLDEDFAVEQQGPVVDPQAYATASGSIHRLATPLLRATVATALVTGTGVVAKQAVPHLRGLGAAYSAAAIATPYLTAAMCAHSPLRAPTCALSSHSRAPLPTLLPARLAVC